MRANEPTIARQHDLNTFVRNWRATTPTVLALPREGALRKICWSLQILNSTSTTSSGQSRLPALFDIPTLTCMSVHTQLIWRRALRDWSHRPYLSQLALGLMTFPHQHSPMSRGTHRLISLLASGKVRYLPVTATSWGAPLSWLTTPVSIEEMYSSYNRTNSTI